MKTLKNIYHFNKMKFLKIFKQFTINKHIYHEELMNSVELISSKGFKVETHQVETKDGYILNVYRFNKGNPTNPVYFQHGLLDSSDGWLCNDEDRCLPFYLAKNDYDIWIGNSRGNIYSRSHIINSPKSKNFWEFSFHEMGLLDIPAILDHIHNHNDKKIIYIGHSQGTTMLFSALTDNLEYFNSKIELFIALGPVGLVKNIDSSLVKYFNKIKIDILANRMKTYEFLPRNEKFALFVNNKFPNIINKITSLISEKRLEDNNLERMRIYLCHYPSGTSYKTLNHFKQMHKSGKLAKYDYGYNMNIQIYNQTTPPEYDLRKIKGTKIALLVGENDRLCHEKDVEWLRSELGENVVFYKSYKNMGHLTFLIPKDKSWFDDISNILKNNKM